MTGQRWTAKQLAGTKTGRKALFGATPKPSKLKAIRQEIDGIKFPSKLEANYYRHLKQLIRAGEVIYFLRQVPFDLDGVKATIDFQIFFTDGRVEYHDPKGRRTASWVRNKKQIETKYPMIVIREIFKGDF